MKYIITFFALFAFSQTSHAQKELQGLMEDSAKLYFEYLGYNGYLNDSTYEKKTSKMAVFLGEKAAIFIYQTETPEEFLNKLRENANPRFITPEQEVESFKKRYDVEKVVSNVWVRYYGAPDYLTIRKYNEGDVWSSDTVIYEWALVDEFKTINGYNCQKATSKNRKKEDIIAWFTEEIPISAWPAFITGLPGLILETYNPSSRRLLKVTAISSTNIPQEFFRKWLKGPVVTRAEDREIYQGESEKAKQFLRMLKSSQQAD